MAEKKRTVEIYSDAETGKGFAPKTADKSKTVKITVNHRLTQIFENVRKGKAKQAERMLKKLSKDEIEEFRKVIDAISRRLYFLGEDAPPPTFSTEQQ